VQLPGMSTDPVRLSLDLTWWPGDGTFSLSRRLWTQPARGSHWTLEDMATSGSPIDESTLAGRWADASRISLDYFLRLVESQGDPFP
jgi:hypothetical protein